MSKMFLCGSFRCKIEIIDDVAAHKANEDRIEWAQQQKRKTGEFPTQKEQIKFTIAAYNRYTNLKIRRGKK